MYCRLPFEYQPSGTAHEIICPASPSKETSCVFPFREFFRNSFVALLLRRSLHNFSALAPVTHLDGITCSQNRTKTGKSFIALLLPHFVPVSPLLHYSYEKIGVLPLPGTSGSRALIMLVRIFRVFSGSGK